MAILGRLAPNSVMNELKVVAGNHVTVAAVDTIDTGLRRVVGAIANLEDAPVAGAQRVEAFIGDQAGTPAAGKIQIKSWKATATADTAVIAGTTFSKKVNWIAFGF